MAALVSGPIFYGILQFLSGRGLFPVHFLLQVLIAFILCVLVMWILTLRNPLPEDWHLPNRYHLDEKSPLFVKVAGAAVVAGVAVFIVLFF